MNTVKILILVALAIGLVYQERQLYKVALKQGEDNYKSSYRIYKAFESAYHYGYQDCKDGRPESWSGE